MTSYPFDDDKLNEIYWQDKKKTVGFKVTIDEDKCGKCSADLQSGMVYLCKKHYWDLNSIVMKAAGDWNKEQE